MKLHTQKTVLSVAFGLLGIAASCAAQSSQVEDLQSLVKDLEKQNETLQIALVASNKAEKKATDQLDRIRIGLEALGKNLLDGGDDRLIQAASDLELANERLQKLESAAFKLSTITQDYLKEAIVADPDIRLRVETAMRELDSVSGLRQKPSPDIRTGNLQKSEVVSLDQQSGMLVLNLGEAQGAKIGMTFRLLHGQQPYGKAILADVRQSISGAFVEELDSKDMAPRLGDTAMILTQN